jgi:hypothetical protein
MLLNGIAVYLAAYGIGPSGDEAEELGGSQGSPVLEGTASHAGSGAGIRAPAGM